MKKLDKYRLAYARKVGNKSMEKEILESTQKGSEDKKHSRLRRFNESLKTARQCGNREMEKRLRDRFARGIVD